MILFIFLYVAHIDMLVYMRIFNSSNIFCITCHVKIFNRILMKL